MSFSRPIQWYHSHADPIWPDDMFIIYAIFRLIKLCWTGPKRL